MPIHARHDKQEETGNNSIGMKEHIFLPVDLSGHIVESKPRRDNKVELPILNEYPRSPLRDGIAALSMLVMFVVFLSIPFVYVGSIIVMLLASLAGNAWLVGATATLTTVTVVTAIFPSKIHAWPRFISSRVWCYWRCYFQFNVIKTTELHADRKYLFAEHPHGIFPMGEWLSQSVHSQLFPGIGHTKGGAADACFRMPVMRHVYSWMGLVSASEDSLRREVAMGYNLALTPGGVAELFMSDIDREVVYVKKRKGFVRLAIKLGTDIVPAYHFGNTQLLRRLSSGKGLFTAASRYLRTALVLFWGRFGLPIPHQHPILMVVGKAIRVDQNENPTDEQVDAVHEQYMSELQWLFDTYKPLFGWEHKELEIR